jgi:hypothetical protein
MKIEFLQDFASFKKKDTTEVQSTLAANLIRRKVAKAYVEKPKKKSKGK